MQRAYFSPMLAVQTLVSSYEHRLVASEGYIESMGGDHVNSLAHSICTSDTRETMSATSHRYLWLKLSGEYAQKK